MVELEHLAAFDCLQWLRTGERAAGVLGISQSTVSRATRRCEQAFEIQLVKREAEWQVQGDPSLLHAERRVHQLYRWSSGRPLRLDAQHWLRQSYGDLPLMGWLKGNLNYMEYTRPLQLMRDRVIDAWLCSSPDHPRDADLSCIPLCDMPTWLLVRNSHPLLQRAEPLTIEVARQYPVLPLPQGAFPVFQAQLDGLGFHSDFSRLKAIAEQHGHDPNACEDMALAIASPLTVHLYGDGWSVLPLDLNIRKGDTLIVHRDLADHPRTTGLIRALANHLHTLAGGRNDARVLAAVPQ